MLKHYSGSLAVGTFFLRRSQNSENICVSPEIMQAMSKTMH
jgi:hypothetical protein